MCEAMEAFAQRFLGLSIDFRTHGTDWPKFWRLRRVATKNERAEYRKTKYFDSFKELVEWVDKQQKEQ